jgi:hypothetical protein
LWLVIAGVELSPLWSEDNPEVIQLDFGKRMLGSPITIPFTLRNGEALPTKVAQVAIGCTCETVRLATKTIEGNGTLAGTIDIAPVKVDAEFNSSVDIKLENGRHFELRIAGSVLAPLRITTQTDGNLLRVEVVRSLDFPEVANLAFEATPRGLWKVSEFTSQSDRAIYRLTCAPMPAIEGKLNGELVVSPLNAENVIVGSPVTHRLMVNIPTSIEYSPKEVFLPAQVRGQPIIIPLSLPGMQMPMLSSAGKEPTDNEFLIHAEDGRILAVGIAGNRNHRVELDFFDKKIVIPIYYATKDK